MPSKAPLRDNSTSNSSIDPICLCIFSNLCRNFYLRNIFREMTREGDRRVRAACTRYAPCRFATGLGRAERTRGAIDIKRNISKGCRGPAIAADDRKRFWPLGFVPDGRTNKRSWLVRDVVRAKRRRARPIVLRYFLPFAAAAEISVDLESRFFTKFVYIILVPGCQPSPPPPLCAYYIVLALLI